MSEKPVEAKIIKKTQDTLGKIIKKPPMTDKLLNKPPFRFLHDTVTSVIKATGFMKGLFSEDELNSDNFKEKEAKIIFLQKVIDMISLVTGKTLSAKPSKIVAGQEAERTNELLQMLADACTKKIDNDDYVKRVLNSDDFIIPKKSKKLKDEDPIEDKPKKSTKESSKEINGDKENGEKQKNKEKIKEKSNDKPKENEKKHKIRDENRDENRGDKKLVKESLDKGKDKDKDKSREKDRSKEREKVRKKETKETERDPSREKEKNTVQKVIKKDDDDDEDDDDEADQKEEYKPIVRPTTAKGSRRTEVKVDENKEKDKPRIMKRPNSSKPAPKIKATDVDDLSAVGGLNRPAVIIDKADNSDDDMFIAANAEEALQPAVASLPKKKQEQDEEENEEMHGGLVKKILETKKDLESKNQTKKTEIERQGGMADASRRKEREAMQRDIDRLRASIQALTRGVNPLGKVLDFLQEDFDSMQREILMWSEENKRNVTALIREQSLTESSIVPLKGQLRDIDLAISDQLELISAIKNNILTNDKKLSNLLSSITKS